MSRSWHYRQQNTNSYGRFELPEAPDITADPAMEFPYFPEGDTLIVISASRKYKLHSTILASSSSVLASLINQFEPPRLTKAGEAYAKQNKLTTRFRFTLVLNEEEGSWVPPASAPNAYEQPMYLLKRQVISENGTVTSPFIQPLGHDNENGRVVPKFLLAWEKVLGAFYNRPIDLGDSEEVGVGMLLELAIEIMKIAEYLNCVAIVNSQIEATFLSVGQTLHRSIASFPAPWVDFAYRLRSKKMFKEALIHATGQYNSIGMKQAILENMYTPSVNQLLAHKAGLLRGLAKNIETMLISWYPDQLMRAKTVGRADRDSIGRASYANDIIAWMALTVFRHWLTQMIVNDKGHQASDMGFEFFRLISRGGDSYLNKNVLNQFHNFFPMSPKGEGVTENRLTEIKHFARDLVKDALINHSLLDTDRFPASHMTCVPVNPEDYPWLRFEPDPLEDFNNVDKGSPGTYETGAYDSDPDADSDADMDEEDDGTATLAHHHKSEGTGETDLEKEDFSYQNMSDQDLEDKNVDHAELYGGRLWNGYQPY